MLRAFVNCAKTVLPALTDTHKQAYRKKRTWWTNGIAALSRRVHNPWVPVLRFSCICAWTPYKEVQTRSYFYRTFWGAAGLCRPYAVLRIRIKLKGRIRIRIRIKVISWIRIRIRINLQMTCQNVWYGIWAYLSTFFKVLSPYLEAGIRIRIKEKVGFGSASK